MGRMEILTGVDRRRDWSDDEKLSILQEAADPDARIADVARRHDIKAQQIYTKSVLHLFGLISCGLEEVPAFRDGKEIADVAEGFGYGIETSGGPFAQQGFEF